MATFKVDVTTIGLYLDNSNEIPELIHKDHDVSDLLKDLDIKSIGGDFGVHKLVLMHRSPQLLETFSKNRPLSSMVFDAPYDVINTVVKIMYGEVVQVPENILSGVTSHLKQLRVNYWVKFGPPPPSEDGRSSSSPSMDDIKLHCREDVLEPFSESTQMTLLSEISEAGCGLMSQSSSQESFTESDTAMLIPLKKGKLEMNK